MRVFLVSRVSNGLDFVIHSCWLVEYTYAETTVRVVDERLKEIEVSYAQDSKKIKEQTNFSAGLEKAFIGNRVQTILQLLEQYSETLK